MKITNKIVGWAVVTLVVAQFFSPQKNEGNLNMDAFLAETKPSKEVQKILEISCFDCHSNVTKYPWYSKITPVNFWMEHHVEEAKDELNFSNWSAYSLKRKEHKFEEIYEEVEEKEMPLNSYTWTHTEANLSQEQISSIVNWAKEVQANYKSQLNSK